MQRKSRNRLAGEPRDTAQFQPNRFAVVDGFDRRYKRCLAGSAGTLGAIRPTSPRCSPWSSVRSRFGIKGAYIVADRSMISAAMIAQLEPVGIDYILGARERSSNEIRETVLNDGGAIVTLIVPRQKGTTELAVKEVKIAGRRYIICQNPAEGRKSLRTARPSEETQWPHAGMASE